MLFVDGDPGPEIRRKLNEMVGTWEQALVEAVGPAGWSPILAVVSDSARRVLQITDWTGGEGTKPATGGYIGATGIVATATLAIDIRGPIGATGPSNTLAIGTVTSAASPSATITGASPNQTLNLVLPKGDKGDTGNTGPANTLTIGTVTTGTASATITGTAPTQVLNLTVPQGIQGIQGPQGLKGDKGDTGNTGPQGIQGVQGVNGDAGWSPIFATVADGARFVLQVTDWAGGAGTKPAVGKYVGATGFVDAIASGVNVRGPAGTGSVSPSGTVAANDLAAFVDSLGTSIKAVKPADLPVSTDTQNALNAKAPLNGTGTSGTWPISITGNAATATKLATSLTINGVAFDGSANISVPVDWSSVTGKPAVIAAGTDAAAARSAIGAGTSNLMLGTTAGTALAGNTPLLPEAPSDGKQYARKDAAWAEVVAGDVTQTGTQTLTNKTIHGNANTITVDGVNEVGFRHVPQNSQSTAYTCVLSDAGKHILHPSADTTARTFTIPANSSVPYPIGTALTFVNQNGTGGVVTIAITTDTMRLAGAGTTGSRTLARNGVATALKITATEWIISGSGLS